MAAPPIPSRAKKRLPASNRGYEFDSEEYDGGQDAHSFQQSPVRYKGAPPSKEENDYRGDGPSPAPAMSSTTDLFRRFMDQEPETVLGKQVKMKGELSFEKLLRIEGSFEGKLISKGGSLHIGKGGQVIGDIEDMAVVLCEGRIVGNITVDRLELRGKAAIHGNISCKSLRCDPTCVVVGTLNVHPMAPSRIDAQGNVVDSKAPAQASAATTA